MLGYKDAQQLVIAIVAVSLLVLVVGTQSTQSAHAVAFNQNVTETVGLTDTRNSNPLKVLLETLSVSDALSATAQVIKNLNETLGLTDTNVRAFSRKLDETLTLSDTVNARISVRNLAETLTLTDTLPKSITRPLSETLTFTDALNARITVKNLSETLALSDALNARITVKNLSETLTLSDTTSSTFSRTLTETLGLSDTLNARIAIRNLSETLALSDTTSAAISIKILSEILTLSDVLSNTVTKNVSETLALSDNVSARISVRNLSETLALSDVLSARISVRNLSETLTLSDTTSSTFSRTLTEALTLSDTINARTSVKGLQESLALSDAVGARLLVKNLVETLTVSAATTTGNTLGLSETLALSDVVSNSYGSSGARAETMSLSDLVALTYVAPTPAGTSVSNNFNGGQGQVGGGTITFSQVTAPGTVSVTPQTSITPPTDGFTLVGLGGSTLAVDISSTAGFTGTIQICLTYSDVGLDLGLEHLLALRHFVGGTWVTITSSLDITTNIICGQTTSLSPFGVMQGQPEIGGSNRERPRYEISDVLPPIISEHYIKPENVFAGDEITVTAQIDDDVGAAEGKILYLTNIKIGPPEFHEQPMEKINSGWWQGTIPSSDVNTDGLSYWLAGIDFGGNVGTSPRVELKIEEAKQQPQPKEKKLVPFTVQTKKVDLQPNDFIELSTIEGKKSVSKYSDTIVIKNNSNSTLHSIRIMLSPELSDSVHVERYSIRSLEPQSNVTIGIKVHGDPNQDAYGKISAYDGNIMVMTPNHNPVMLPVNIVSVDSSHYQTYLEMISEMTQLRYNKISMINTILKSGSIEKSDVEITTRTGQKEINIPSEELVIKNLSNRTLNNIRLMVSNVGSSFLLDTYNIQHIEPNGEVSVRMIPMMDTNKYTPRDIKGEIIVAPENSIPRAINVHIPAVTRHDSLDEFEVRLIGNEMTTAFDRISIKNTGNRTMDSVKIILSSNLARIFSLSEDSFQRIDAGEEVNVEVTYNAKDLRTFLQNFEGTIQIASEHHNTHTIPVEINWNKVESDNFVIYARNGDQVFANSVLKHLENHYENVTKAFGTVNSKATIYVTGSLEEMQVLNSYGYSFYSYNDDIIFVCSCDAKDGALQEFIYRAMIKNFPTYYNMKKIDSDNGNWLLDGLAKYMVVRNNETASMTFINAFKESPTAFQWYGAATDARYGSAITFFTYLEEVYGEDAIYRSLYYLGSGMVSNHKCDTVENCAVLRGVYDAGGMDMDRKRFTLDFKTLVSEWEKYVKESFEAVIEDDE